jgi:hypothetical protein
MQGRVKKEIPTGPRFVRMPVGTVVVYIYMDVALFILRCAWQTQQCTKRTAVISKWSKLYAFERALQIWNFSLCLPPIFIAGNNWKCLLPLNVPVVGPVSQHPWAKLGLCTSSAAYVRNADIRFIISEGWAGSWMIHDCFPLLLEGWHHPFWAQNRHRSYHGPCSVSLTSPVLPSPPHSSLPPSCYVFTEKEPGSPLEVSPLWVSVLRTIRRKGAFPSVLFPILLYLEFGFHP